MNTRRDFLASLGGASMALVLAPDLAAQSPSLAPGTTKLLECLGRGPGRHRYLDGNTVNASVGVRPLRAKPLSGMWWRVVRVSDRIVALQCRGDVDGNRWLDGNTVTGAVTLAPHTREPFSGTRWEVVPIDRNDPRVFALRCLGNIKTDRKWLDGNTEHGIVTLATTTDPPFTGTRWRAGGIVDEG
jgi:hypothetical protein